MCSFKFKLFVVFFNTKRAGCEAIIIVTFTAIGCNAFTIRKITFMEVGMTIAAVLMFHRFSHTFVFMTFLTIHLFVFPQQFEIGLVMVKSLHCFVEEE